MQHRRLNQPLTLWSFTGQNGYGEDSYATPVVVYGRWEDRAELVRTPTNEEVTSKAVVYMAPGVTVAVGDHLVQGDQTAVGDPSLVAGAWEIVAVAVIPNLRSNSMETRAYL